MVTIDGKNFFPQQFVKKSRKRKNKDKKRERQALAIKEDDGQMEDDKSQEQQ